MAEKSTTTVPCGGATFIGYYRVSTPRQAASGLGFDVQRTTVRRYVADAGGDLAAEYQETASGAKAGRIELVRALEHCRRTGATLVVACIDRLARSTDLLPWLEGSGVSIVACDKPLTGRLELFAEVAKAEEERRLIRERTKAALAAAKARGKKIGNPMGAKAFGPNAGKGSLEVRRAKAKAFVDLVGTTVSALRAQGMSFRAVAAELNAMGVQARRGGQWSPNAVKRVEDALKAQ
ncbi:MAG: recombinase family protein, partial [Desulfovibrio sp.]|nr:recombinase family protein [Desulfovibrio sp.]